MFSKIGLHEGNVKIEEDPKLSQDCYRVPRKASIGGVKAKSFLRLSIKDTNSKENSNLFKKCKVIHRVVKDNASGGAIQNHTANLWKSLNRIFNYVEKHSWDASKITSFQEALLHWKKAYLAGWGRKDITHYMVSF